MALNQKKVLITFRTSLLANPGRVIKNHRLIAFPNTGD